MFLTTGARKKKGLTDTITILPFPAQSLRKETPRRIIEENVKEPATKLYVNKLVNSQAEQLPLKAPSKTISIKQALADEKERQLKSLEEKARELFSTDQLIMAWKQYAFTMKEIGKDTFFHALTKREPSFVNLIQNHERLLLLHYHFLRFELLYSFPYQEPWETFRLLCKFPQQ